MAIIDISSQLTAAKPILQLSETEQYDINDDKNIVLKANALMSDDLKEGENEFDNLFKGLELLLGKPALKSIEANHPGATKSINQIMVLFLAAMAGVTGVTYEEMENSFRQSQQ